MEDKPLDWKGAHRHMLETMSYYFDLLDDPSANVEFALRLTFLPLLERYLGGERTREIYEEMMGVE